MRDDGKLERFDELRLVDTNLDRSNDPSSYTRAGGNVSVDQWMNHVDEALKYYQSYHRLTSVDKWTVVLPFAWEIAKGMQVLNETKDDVYTVSGVYRDSQDNPTGVVVLDGRVVPDAADRLLIESDYRLRFMHGYPKSQQEYFRVDDSDTTGQHSGAWMDTITWMVTRSEPGAVSGAPFSGMRQRKTLGRETYIDPEDEGRALVISGQWFDNLVTFDMWAQTQEESALLYRWFQDFMTLNRWVFKFNGLVELMFWERRPDNASAAMRDKITSRTATWYARTEELYQSAWRRINTLSMYASLTGADATGTIGTLDPTGAVSYEVTE